MRKDEIDDTVRANHELVKDSKIEFAALLSGLCLSGSEHQVALYLAVYKANGASGQCNPKITTICKETGLPESTVYAALAKLKSLGIIALTVKRKGSVWYYMAMPVLPKAIEAAREEARREAKKAKPRNLRKSRGTTSGNPEVLYEVGKRTVGEDISIGVGHGIASGGASPSSSLWSEAVAGSSNSPVVDFDMGKKRGEKEISPSSNMYRAMKDGDIPLPPDLATLFDFSEADIRKAG